MFEIRQSASYQVCALTRTPLHTPKKLYLGVIFLTHLLCVFLKICWGVWNIASLIYEFTSKSCDVLHVINFVWRTLDILTRIYHLCSLFVTVGMPRSEAVACQRQMLKKKLGLGVPGSSMDFGIDSLLDDEDLVSDRSRDKTTMMQQLSTEVWKLGIFSGIILWKCLHKISYNEYQIYNIINISRLYFQVLFQG